MWISTLPLKEEGYSLSKQEIWNVKMIYDDHSLAYQICVTVEQSLIFSTVYQARRVALFH